MIYEIVRLLESLSSELKADSTCSLFFLKLAILDVKSANIFVSALSFFASNNENSFLATISDDTSAALNY